MSKTIKKSYTKSKRFDKSCRNHGKCDYCKSNRLYQSNKQPLLKESLNLQ